MSTTQTRFSVEYVAGVIDARAHIEVLNRHGKPQPRLSVTTRRVDLLQYLSRITGTRVSYDNRGYQRRPCGEHCGAPHSHVVRQSAKWRVDSARATIVLYNVAPFMVSRKDEVAEALRVGLDVWPAARGNTGALMKELGWHLPS